MRMVLTDIELECSRKLQEQLSGMTLDEALHALAHARGVIGLQLSEKVGAFTFHPTGADSP